MSKKKPTEPKPCPHNLFWYAAPANEEGWRCVECDFKPGEPPGYSPQTDRDHIDTKVGSVLMDLHTADIIYVSNGSEGDSITATVARRCVDEDIYDSVSIARFILEIEAGESHVKYWRETSAGVLSGNDTRHRCKCGALATSSTYFRGTVTRSCSACPDESLNGGPF